MIEDLQEWRRKRQAEIERERILELASVFKVEILNQYVFRNSNPAIFGVRVTGGKMRSGVSLIDEDGEEISRIKGMQCEKETVDEACEGKEVAVSLPGVNFERRLGDKKFIYSNISESQFKKFKQNKDLLSPAELQVLQEISLIKRRKNPDWGM